MTPNEMLVLYEFNAWANRRMLERSRQVKPKEFLRPMGFEFRFLAGHRGRIFTEGMGVAGGAFRGGRRLPCRTRRNFRMWQVCAKGGRSSRGDCLDLSAR